MAMAAAGINFVFISVCLRGLKTDVIFIVVIAIEVDRGSVSGIFSIGRYAFVLLWSCGLLRFALGRCTLRVPAQRGIIFDLEERNNFFQVPGLGIKLFGAGSHLFGRSSIRLHHLVELLNGG